MKTMSVETFLADVAKHEFRVRLSASAFPAAKLRQHVVRDNHVARQFNDPRRYGIVVILAGPGYVHILPLGSTKNQPVLLD